MATKVFLSWSGDLSRKLAEAFRDWLPNVLQNTETFFSSADIEKGTEWLATIKKELADSTMGVLFITPTNTDAPWLLFEAGVMANRFEDNAKVCPILFNLKRTNFTGPLSHYQNTINSREDILKLIHSVNNSADTSDTIKPDILERAYDRWWDDLAKAFSEILENHTEEAAPKPERSDREILGEILGIVRILERISAKEEEGDLRTEYSGPYLDVEISGDERSVSGMVYYLLLKNCSRLVSQSKNCQVVRIFESKKPIREFMENCERLSKEYNVKIRFEVDD